MNRRTFLTGLLATTATIPIARAFPQPTMLFRSYGSGKGLVYGVDMSGCDRTVVMLFEQRMDACYALMRKNLVEYAFADGVHGPSLLDLVEDDE